MDQVLEREIRSQQSPGNALTIRPLTSSHLSPLLEIAKESFDVVWSEKDFLHCLENPDGRTFGVFYEERLIAYFLGLDVQGDIDIVSIAVAKNARKAGVAFSLLSHVLASAKHAAFLEVDLRNQAAIALYRKAGFVDVRIRRAYYEKKYDALCMHWERVVKPTLSF